MSEKLPSVERKESLASKHETLALPTAEQAEKLRKGEADPLKTAESARVEIAKNAEESAKPLERLDAATESGKPKQSLHVNTELKSITLRRELNDIRRKLPAKDKALSKVIHQPVVRVVSEVAGKTLSRPSGLLGGGIVALIGTSLYLYIASSAGIQYNYFVFLALFVGGFALGLALELAVFAATSSRRHSND